MTRTPTALLPLPSSTLLLLLRRPSSYHPPSTSLSSSSSSTTSAPRWSPRSSSSVSSSSTTTKYDENGETSSLTSSSSPTTAAAPSSSSTGNNNYRRRSVRVRSALNHGPLPYEVGWAYQKALLDRRLEYMRSSRIRRRRDTADYGLVSANYDDGREGYGGDDDEEEEDVRDHLLLFEHEPTYTLGRGASVEHLTFLREDVNDGTSRIDDRRRLSRDYREIDASRLNVDRSSMSSSRDGGGGIDDEAHRLLSCRRHHASKYPPVYAPNGCPVHRVERGGEVTYHGPGQLVMYPLMNLDVDDAPGGGNGNGGDRSRRDLHGYLRDMEEVAMRTLSHYGVTSYRDPQNTGVWVSGSKIAASGVSCTRWITTHGLSLNVNVDLRYFDGDVVTPCGIGDRGVTSLERVLFGDGMEDDDCHDCPTVEEVGKVASECFGEVFGVDLIWGEEVRR